MLKAKRRAYAPASRERTVTRMIESISPYALLCASKPKHAPTVVTAYDLYSQAQQSREQPVPANVPAPSAQETATALPPARPLSSVPSRRTHYIADIQSRHSAATQRTPMHSHPLT